MTVSSESAGIDVEQVLKLLREGIDIADTAVRRIEAFLVESDAEFEAACARLRRVGL
jgi:hypothetical protein